VLFFNTFQPAASAAFFIFPPLSISVPSFTIQSPTPYLVPSFIPRPIPKNHQSKKFHIPTLLSMSKEAYPPPDTKKSPLAANLYILPVQLSHITSCHQHPPPH
jgi:hypothetical protein